MVVQNPNWPLIDEAVSFESGPNSVAPYQHWCSMVERSEGNWSAAYGKQYELNQYQALVCNTTWQDRDAALDPANIASPFYPQVTLYRAYRRRAQYPATVNLLDRANAAGSSVTIPVNGSGLLTYANWSVTPGQAYTAQAQVLSDLYNGVDFIGTAAQIGLRWYDVSGNVISTVLGGSYTAPQSSSFPPTGLVTVTATAPANAAGAAIIVTGVGNGAYQVTLSASDVQVEKGSTASRWANPGVWYDLASGFVSGWPSAFSDGGLYAVVNPTITDAFGPLSQRPIKSPGYMQALLLGPSWFYPLDEGSGATSASDLTHQMGKAPLLTLGAGTALQTMAFGQSASSGSSGGALPPGTGGPVLKSTCPGGAAPASFTCTVLDLAAAGVSLPYQRAWTRVLAFYVPVATGTQPGSQMFNMNGYGVADQSDIWAYAQYASNGHFGAAGGVPLTVYFDTGQVTAASLTDARGNTDLSDGNWHLLIFGTDGSSVVAGWLDDTAMTTFYSGTTPLGDALTDFTTDILGGYNGSATGVGPTNASYSFYAEFPYLFTATQADELWSAWKYAGSGDNVASSASRFADILRWAGWQGQSATSGSGTITYGPSSDLQASTTDRGTDVVSALQTVVDTDNGAMFVDAAGVVTFQGRTDAYNLTPQFVLGEGATGPYRTNLCPNPSFEHGMTGWSTTGGASLNPSAGYSHAGSMSAYLYVPASSPQFAGIESSQIPVTAGDTYALGMWVFPYDTPSTTYSLTLQWLTSTGAYVSNSTAMVTMNPASPVQTWTQLTLVATAPANAALAVIIFNSLSGPTGATADEVYIDTILLEQDDKVNPYFDGDTTGSGWTYAWTGTVGASASTVTAVEAPYTAAQPGFDAARLANDIQLTQLSTQAATRAYDQASIDVTGDIQLQRTVNTLDAYEMDDAASYLLTRYKDPSPRMDQVTVDLAATNAWWLLGLTLGACVRVMRRPPSPYPAVTYDLIVEQINLSMDEAGNASLTLALTEIGPQFWQLDSPQWGVLESTTVVGY